MKALLIFYALFYGAALLGLLVFTVRYIYRVITKKQKPFPSFSEWQSGQIGSFGGKSGVH